MSGLRKLPPDPHDYRLGSVIDLPALSEVPEVFSLTPLSIKDQKDSDFCTAFSTCGASELQEGVELCPEFTFAVTKKLEGDMESWGADLRTACKAHVKVGAIEKSESPFSLENQSEDFLRNPDVWEEILYVKARKHKKKSFFAITGPYDSFDNIRASIYYFQEKKQAVVLGIEWAWPLAVERVETPAIGRGHAVYAVGCEGEYLDIVNSYGNAAGKEGHLYVHRSVINTSVPEYGAFMFTDISASSTEPKDELQQLLERILEWPETLFRGTARLLTNTFSK